MAIITIGKDQQYANPYYAAPHVQAGDTVEIFPGTYGGAWFWAGNITIKGMGPGVIISTPQLTQGKGLFVLSGSNVTVDGITFSGATNSTGNGAGINFTGTNLTVTNSTFLNNQDGILTSANKNSTITVRNSIFDGNGSNAGSQGAAHAIYAGAAALLDVQDSTFTNTQQGHSIKSRADNTIVKHNSITDGLTGTSSYLIDIPNGGAATITGNYLEKGPHSANYSYAINMGEEGVKNPAGPILIADNTYVNDDKAGVFAHNQTGNPDFTVSNNIISGQLTTVLAGPGTVIDPPPPTPLAPEYLKPDTRDFNADGKDDILAMSVSGSTVQVALMDGTTKLSYTVLSGPAKTGWTACLTGDFNSDGRADIVWQNSTTQDIAIYAMDGTTKTVCSTIAPGVGWKITGAGDFDGDKSADLVLQNGTQVEVWQMNGAAGSVLSTAAPDGFKVIATGDFNNDGDADILWQNSTTGEMQAWMMNGASVVSTAALDNPGVGWRTVDTGDFDGDGHTDILLQNNTSGQCAVWLMDGTTKVGGGNLANNPGAAMKATGAGDYNGDGMSDILFRNSTSGAFSEWMMSGASLLSSGVSGFKPGTTFAAVAG